jgi:NADH dehydrogenase
VKDVATAFRKALDEPKTAGEIYELGGPEIFSYEQLLDAIAQKLDKGRKPRSTSRRDDEDRRQALGSAPSRPPSPGHQEQLTMLAIDNATNNSATPKLLGGPARSLRDNMDYILTK